METEGGSANRETWNCQARGLKCGSSRGEANRNLVLKQWFSLRSGPVGRKPNILRGMCANNGDALAHSSTRAGSGIPR